MATVWNSDELDLIVADYFKMLEMELRGIPFNKAEHNRNLRKKLRNRSKGSVEFKHQNISAVLQQLGKIYIFGYKPLQNFQSDLLEAVVSYLERHTEIENTFRLFSEERPDISRSDVNYEQWKESIPEIIASEPIPRSYRKRIGHVNWLIKEEQNRAIGYAGEELVFNYEIWRLSALGKESLSKKVEWTSEEKGDGAGYDIRSYNHDGTDRFIEVKTTKLGNTTPIFFSRNELEVSRELGSAYTLCRVSQLTRKPRMFEARGSLDQICLRIEPQSFKGFF